MYIRFEIYLSLLRLKRSPRDGVIKGKRHAFRRHFTFRLQSEIPDGQTCRVEEIVRRPGFGHVTPAHVQTVNVVLQFIEIGTQQTVTHNGAEAGCQAEVGTACSMASAAANQLFGGSAAQIEYAAEMGLEHHLGMTCDPVCGLVQIPCIERNAYAAARALDANLYSSFTDGMHRVSFDKVVEVMKQTGNDLPSLYKETSEGGLAKDYKPME